MSEQMSYACGSLLDKSALAVRGEANCRTTGKYRELLGFPEGQG